MTDLQGDHEEPPTFVTCAKAVEQLDTFLERAGMPAAAPGGRPPARVEDVDLDRG
ncbi:MAG TPA: hypothetical protein VF802_07890 [Candidatus Limnocylindrales bacterium]